jgi:hypothetical protein
MPFDEGEEHSGGGDDPHHEGIEDFADTMMEMIIKSARAIELCVDCSVHNVGIRCIAGMMVRHNCMEENWEINEKQLKKLVTSLIRDASEEAKNIIEFNKRRRENDKPHH